ncbi:MAG: ABC transporter permease [Beduini sp.]
MRTFIGVPPSMVEIYGSDIKKMYIANKIPICFGVITLVVSAFIHLMIMSIIIFVLAPIVFHATMPSNIPLYFLTLALFIIVSLAISCVLGLAVKNQVKLTSYSQVVFLPSIMLSGIIFSAELLPNFLENMEKLFPATLLIQKNIDVSTFFPLIIILIISILASVQLLKKIRSE